MDCNPTAENIARLIYEHARESRTAGRRSRALGDRALFLDLCIDDMRSIRAGQWAWP